MNTKQNLKFQQTDQKIRKIFITLFKKEPFEKITVRRICELSHINRSSFYLHYDDVYDLMDKIESDMSSYFATIFMEKNSSDYEKRFVKLFSFILENHEFYKAYLNTVGQSHAINGMIPDSARAFLPNTEHTPGRRSPQEIHYQGIFFASGLTALIRE